MGCILNICVKSNQNDVDFDNIQAEPIKEYSWDKRSKIDPKDFILDGASNTMVGRLPGQIEGQQFIVQNCKNSYIYLFDHINTISVDDCEDCHIFIGPVKTSVFIRDCKNCVFIVACQQFRTRDCHKVDVFLSCVSQPIIESSSKMRFAHYQYFYPELADQFNKAGISPFNCTWSDIHDFTPVEESNYILLSESVSKRPQDLFAPPSDAVDLIAGGVDPLSATSPEHRTEDGETSNNNHNNKFLANDLLSVEVDMSEPQSVVLCTHGKRRWDSETPRCFLLCFQATNPVVQNQVREVVRVFQSGHEDCVLLDSAEVTMDADDGERILCTENFRNDFAKGPVIGLVLSGADIHSQLKQLAGNFLKDVKYFLSENHNSAIQQIDRFYNFLKMQRNTQ